MKSTRSAQSTEGHFKQIGEAAVAYAQQPWRQAALGRGARPCCGCHRSLLGERRDQLGGLGPARPFADHPVFPGQHHRPGERALPVHSDDRQVGGGWQVEQGVGSSRDGANRLAKRIDGQRWFWRKGVRAQVSEGSCSSSSLFRFLRARMRTDIRFAGSFHTRVARVGETKNGFSHGRWGDRNLRPLLA